MAKFKGSEYLNKKYTMKDGNIVTIIKYNGYTNVDIEYEDGTVLKNRKVNCLKRGKIEKPINRVGEVYSLNQGYTAKILEYDSYNTYKILISDGTILENLQYNQIKKGTVENPNHRTVCDIGYIGIGKYSLKDLFGENTNYSITWKNIIRRCSKKPKENVTYHDCLISKEWECLQNFAYWYETNYKEGWHVDKDILVKGNKVYSSETCCFVPQEINNLFTLRSNYRGALPIGVHKVGNKFKAQISRYGVRIPLGDFDTPEEAFYTYKIAKEEYIKEVANKWRGQITEECYWALMNYKVDIKD